MNCRRAGQGVEVVAAFEGRDQFAAAMLGGRLQQFLGHPGEIRLDQSELGQRVSDMGVEAGRHQKKVGRELVECRQDALLEGRAEIVAVIAGGKRR